MRIFGGGGSFLNASAEVHETTFYDEGTRYVVSDTDTVSSGVIGVS